MKKRIAIYRLSQYPNSSGDISEVSDYKESDKDWVRLSEIIEVDFPPRDQDEVIQQSVTKLDELIKTEVTEHLQRLTDLNNTKRELLALAHSPETPEPITQPPVVEDDIPF